MKSFQNSRDAAATAPAPPTKIDRQPSAPTAKQSRRSPADRTNAQKIHSRASRNTDASNRPPGD
jgi:hypothetical protein